MWKKVTRLFPRWRILGDWQADGETLACSQEVFHQRDWQQQSDQLKKALGQAEMLRLWFHANGIDRAMFLSPIKAKSQGLGNSQILPRDYVSYRISKLFSEKWQEQVAVRLRGPGKGATLVSNLCWFLKQEVRPIHAQMKIRPTNIQLS